MTFAAEHAIYFDGIASLISGPMLPVIVHGATAVLLELNGIEEGTTTQIFGQHWPRSTTPRRTPSANR
ncbi:MAG: hypothetical protein GY736_04085 [Sphingomonas sp.]|nr:hypothetical protein [Sphingomonas sp.]